MEEKTNSIKNKKKKNKQKQSRVWGIKKEKCIQPSKPTEHAITIRNKMFPASKKQINMFLNLFRRILAKKRTEIQKWAQLSAF